MLLRTDEKSKYLLLLLLLYLDLTWDCIQVLFGGFVGGLLDTNLLSGLILIVQRDQGRGHSQNLYSTGIGDAY